MAAQSYCSGSTDDIVCIYNIYYIPTPTDSCKFVGHVGKPAFVNQNPEMRFRSFLSSSKFHTSAPPDRQEMPRAFFVQEVGSHLCSTEAGTPRPNKIAQNKIDWIKNVLKEMKSMDSLWIIFGIFSNSPWDNPTCFHVLSISRDEGPLQCTLY